MQVYEYTLLADGYNTAKILKTNRGFIARVPGLNLELCTETFEDSERALRAELSARRMNETLPVVQV